MNIKEAKHTERSIKAFIDFASHFKEFKPIEETKEYNKFIDFLEKEKSIMFMDHSNISALVFTKKEPLILFLSLFEVDDERLIKQPDLSYVFHKEEVGEATAKYSTEYMAILLKFCVSCGNATFRLSVKKEYPLTATFEELGLKFVLAPRVESD